MPPPRGGGALLRNLSDNYAHSGALNATENLTPEEQAKAELDANILAGGGLGLDPENDPIVATTDWGLDIMFHNVGEGTYTTNPPANGSLLEGALKGYLYFTGGDYDGVTGLKWVIIGYSTNTVSSGPVTADHTNVNPDKTDAGNVIKNFGSRGLVYVNGYKIPAYSSASPSSEIPAGCVLCISENNIFRSRFSSSCGDNAGDGYYKGARWKYSDLRTELSNICENKDDLGIKNFETISNRVKTVTITTYSQTRSATTANTYPDIKDTSSDKFFLLAASHMNSDDNARWPTSLYKQEYLLETYLGYDSNRLQRQSYRHNTTTYEDWWLRSGDIAGSYSSYYYNNIYVRSTGTTFSTQCTVTKGIRPAFVLKL